MRVAVVGGGMVGLCTAMLLARDGNDVTVLERDEAPAPDPENAWEDWERRGVNQFRLAHLFLARFNALIAAELPELRSDFVSAGALAWNVVANIPDDFTGGARDGDEMFDLLTGRRSVMEAVAARRAEDSAGVTIRRGCTVAGLEGGPRDGSVPHVTGVRLSEGGTVDADLVLDVGGRRSALPTWLEAIHAAPCHEELEDSGFVYFGRHFRSADGALPVAIGPPRQDYGTLTALTLPADNGTWSVTLVASARDTAMRALREADTWTTVVRSLPLAAHWLDGEPLEERIVFMGKIEDRIRDTAPDGAPVVTGVLSVGDAWACTNPSLGRGVSIGAMHAVALRDLLRSDATRSPMALAQGWREITQATVEPWYRTTLHFDRHRLAQVEAEMEGRPYDPPDDEWRLQAALGRATLADPGNVRAQISMAMMWRLPSEVFAERAFTERVLAQAQELANEPALGPNRAELLAMVG
jgi:2-polyprenyl-6-methoxyphenol hydroxylase-like FAD-dependent oxidoreductase